MFGCSLPSIRKYILVVINIYYILLDSLAPFGLYYAEGLPNMIVPDNH